VNAVPLEAAIVAQVDGSVGAFLDVGDRGRECNTGCYCGENDGELHLDERKFSEEVLSR